MTRRPSKPPSSHARSGELYYSPRRGVRIRECIGYNWTFYVRADEDPHFLDLMINPQREIKDPPGAPQ